MAIGIKTRAPALPIADTRTGVDLGYIGRFLNVLRLYFAQLDAANAATNTAIDNLTVAVEDAKRYTLVMS